MATQAFYSTFDDLAALPPLAAQNYRFETAWLVQHLPKAARVLQVGSHDGHTALALLSQRPDIDFTGLEIEPAYALKARQLLAAAGKKASFLKGDITHPLGDLYDFDIVLCLNNTLGYIHNQVQAHKQMRRLGQSVVISVFGEAFGEGLARAYFHATGREVARVEPTHFILGDATVRRYAKADVESWDGKAINTPLGYLVIINNTHLSR